MRAIVFLAISLAALLACGDAAFAAGRSKSSGRASSYKVKKPSYKVGKHSYKYKPTVKGKRRAKPYCANCARDGKGRIRRSPAARRQFQKANPCPSTGKATGKCPGYVIDHVVPLKRGGPDAPLNMQWQTLEAAKAKDKTED
jgi:hypothetical protein